VTGLLLSFERRERRMLGISIFEWRKRKRKKRRIHDDEFA
jgi:hypothetical protein